MKTIIEQVEAWPFLDTLPPECAGFALDRELAESGTQYLMFSYRKPQDHRSFAVLYDHATKDFMGRITVGLTEYFDVTFISTDLAGLEKILAERLPRTLDRLAGDEGYESIFRAKKILEWDYGRQLPRELAGFTLFISPERPIPTINGSYIILDYSDFSEESNLILYYNVYRDEFFGEIRFRRTPEMAGQFDAKDLPELAGKVSDNLQGTLEALRGRLNEAGRGEDR
ncbi:MAG TPA: hypothetical protein PKA10_09955 [Selenomonadales bacterium]|nr:hypothetical protein [Selenomonadales bacterium]